MNLIDVVFLSLLLVSLVFVSWLDIKFRRIPNVLILFLASAGFARIVLSEGGDISLRILVCIAIVALGMIASIAAERFWGRPALGMGDVKLFAVFPFWVELDLLPLLLTVAASLGIGFILVFQRDRGAPLPFGPFLSLACVIVILPDVARGLL